MLPLPCVRLPFAIAFLLACAAVGFGSQAGPITEFSWCSNIGEEEGMVDRVNIGLECRTEQGVVKFRVARDCGTDSTCLDADLIRPTYMHRFGNCGGGILAFSRNDSTLLYYLKTKSHVGRFYSMELVEPLCSGSALWVFHGTARNPRIFQFPFQGGTGFKFTAPALPKGSYSPPVQLRKVSDTLVRFEDAQGQKDDFRQIPYVPGKP